MKKYICWLLAALTLFVTGCGSGSTGAQTKEGDYIEFGTTTQQPPGMTVAAENDSLILRIDRATTDIELVQKATGYVWSSRGNNKTDGDGKPLSFTYLDTTGSVATMNTMTDSVAKGQYRIETMENGVRVLYSFGDVVKDLLYPSYISAQRFEAFTEKMDARKAATISPLYQHLAPGIYGDDIYAEMIRKYPAAKDKDVYVLRSADMLLTAKKELAAAFEEAGYTAKDLEKDNAEFGISGGVSSTKSILFNIGMEYVLEGGDLVVRLPAEQLYWPEDGSGIEVLSLLPYFGAPAAGSKGYFVLPDGAGSVMEFYNGSERAGQISFLEMYGENLSIAKEERIYDLQQTIFPVYGAKVGDSAFFTVIEKGDAIVRLNALPGTDTLAARAWADFNILDAQAVYAKSLSGSGTVAKSSYTKEQAQPYSGDICMRYHFLSGEQADYSGMARYYRQKLFGNGQSAGGDTVPFYLEAVSAVDYTRTKAGFSQHTVSTLTTFAQAGDMVEELSAAGVDRQKLILSGWQRSGWQNGYVEKARISTAAGGEKGLLELSRRLKNRGVEFFPESDVQLVYRSAVSGSVNKNLTARSLVQQLTRMFRYKRSDFQKGAVVAYGMNGTYTADSIRHITGRLQELDIAGVSLRYAARYVIPDYKDGSVCDRQETMDGLTAAVEEAAGKGMKLLSRTGNAPVAVHTGDIVELPLYSNDIGNSTYPIPFAAMVYSGRLEYAGEAANLMGVGSKDVLKMIESGAGVYFQLTARSDENIRSSNFDWLYSSCFADWKDTAVETYRQVAQALDGVYGCGIERHDRLQTNVYRTTFENGVYIIANYNEYAVTVDGQPVAANGYIRGKNG